MSDCPPSVLSPDCAQLQTTLDRLRTLLETLAVRGLRACGEEELAQLHGYTEELEQSGVSHVAGALADLHAKIQGDDRAAPRALIVAQTSVRLLERLLTLRVARAAFDMALGAGDDDGIKDEDEDEPTEA